MSYKNAMAGLPLGGGKAVILADEGPDQDARNARRFGRAVDGPGGRYVTAEDVGMSVADMIEIAPDPISSPACRGGRRGRRRSRPAHSLGVFLGIKAAVKRALGKDSLAGLHIALQGAGSVATGCRPPRRAEGALSIADVDRPRRRSSPPRPAARSSARTRS
jgi:leucine dehydrogenase